MSKGTCTTIQLLATGVIAFLSEKLGITFYLLGLLVFLMVVDYISGMIASMVEAIDHPTVGQVRKERRVLQRKLHI